MTDTEQQVFDKLRRAPFHVIKGKAFDIMGSWAMEDVIRRYNAGSPNGLNSRIENISSLLQEMNWTKKEFIEELLKL